jgi:hypothetical protein
MSLRRVLQTVMHPPRSGALRHSWQAGGAAVSGMKLGMNLGNITTYSNAKPFANLLFGAEAFQQTVGTGSFTQSQGTISATVSTDIFRSIAHNPNVGATLAADTYTLVNPTGVAMAVSGYNDGSGLTFVAGDQSFIYDGTSFICWFVKGSLPAGATMPYLVRNSDKAAYEAGNPWRPEFIAWLQFLNPKVLRAMDWTSPMYSCEEDFADRVAPNRPTFHKQEVSYYGNVVPYEFLVDLANRLNKDVWVCCPPRGTAAYRTALAALMNDGTGAVATPGCGNVGMTGLAAGLRWYVEYSNELWNPGNPYALGGNWVGSISAPRYTATCHTGTNTFTTTTPHNLTTGDFIRGFQSKASRANGSDESGNYKYLYTLGGRDYVTVIDPNTFQLSDPNDGTHTPIVIEADMVSIIYSKEADMAPAASFLDALRANTGTESLDLWTKAAAAMGTSRIVRIAPSQSAGGQAMTAAILNPTGVAEACDGVAIAPYNRAEIMGGSVDISTGQILPKFWCNQSGTVHVGVYASGSTPTKADILAGTGTGFVAHQSAAYSYAAGYTSLAAVTGLTNGTSYEVFYVFVSGLTGRSGYTWVFSASVTVSATTSTVAVDDTFANLNSRVKLYTDIDSLSEIQSHLAAIAASRNTAIKLMAYEANNEWSQSRPADVSTWLTSYLKSSSNADGLNHYLRTFASQGMDTCCIYSDHLGFSNFDMADSYTATTDVRATQVHSYTGTVPASTKVTVVDVTASNIPTAPTLPYTVATFADASLTYSLIGGDDVGNYSITGNVLTMNSTTGINFGTPTQVFLKVRATNGVTDCPFTVNFFTGSSWRESDAVWAHNTTTDTDTAQFNPDVGSAVGLAIGSAMVASGGVWTNTNGEYSASVGLSAPVDLTHNALFVVVGNKGSMSGTPLQPMFQFGAFPRLHAGTWGSAMLFDWHVQSGTIDQTFTGSAFTSTLGVRWFFVDVTNNVLRWGLNQTEDPGSGITIPANFPTSLSQDLDIGINQAPAVWGSSEVVPRAGMTLADAKAIVQKLMTLHSIP